jgi:hypothetical protein
MEAENLGKRMSREERKRRNEAAGRIQYQQDLLTQNAVRRAKGDDGNGRLGNP